MGVKLSLEIFKKLKDEKKKADSHAMNVDLAIQSLQNICKHEWESDPLAYQEPPSCKTCGMIKKNSNP